jgi:hypothetical protein
MYGLLYECKFLTIEETNKKNKTKTKKISINNPESPEVFELRYGPKPSLLVK